MKDEEFSPGVVDEESGNHGGDIGIGGIESAETDQQVAGGRPDKKGNERNRIEENEFVMPFMFSGFKNKQDIQNVCGEIGKHEADDLVDPVVPQTNRFRDRTDIQIKQSEQFAEGIAFGQCGKDRPGKQKEDADIHHRRRAAAHPVFDELHKMVVFLGQKSLNLFFHRPRVCRKPLRFAIPFHAEWTPKGLNVKIFTLCEGVTL